MCKLKRYLMSSSKAQSQHRSKTIISCVLYFNCPVLEVLNSHKSRTAHFHQIKMGLIAFSSHVRVSWFSFKLQPSFLSYPGIVPISLQSNKSSLSGNLDDNGKHTSTLTKHMFCDRRQLNRHQTNKHNSMLNKLAQKNTQGGFLFNLLLFRA